MDANPFTPPGTTDLEPPVALPPGEILLTAAALRELDATRPWLRWTARLAAVGLVLGVARAIVMVRSAKDDRTAGTVIVIQVLVIPMAIAFLIIFRRAARHLDRFFAGDAGALAAALGAQRSYIKLTGVLLLIIAGLAVPLLVIGSYLLIVKAKAGGP